MANNNTKRNNALRRKAKQHFHGSTCDTSWNPKKNPANKRRSKHDYGTVRSRTGGAS